MRKLILVLLIATLFMLFGVAVHAQTSSDDALKIARQIIANLVKGDYDSVVATFDEAMNKALTKESLKTAWESLIQQEGAYQGEITQSVQDSQSFKVVTLTLQFKNGALDARLPINSKGQLSGLQFVPNTTAGATPTPPTYADLTTFTETDVKVGAGTDFELPGTLSMPKGAGKFPAVILIQGSGPSNRDEAIGPNKPFHDIAWGLASQGIAVLRYDKRTFVYGAKSMVKGFTVKEEYIDDVLAAVNLLSKTDKIDPARIFILGHSEGGIVAPRIVAAEPRIAGVIFAAGITSRSLETAILAQLQYIASLDSTVSPEMQKAIDDAKQLIDKVNALTPQSDLTQIIYGAPASYWLDLRDYDAIKAASQLKVPLFIAQGERDYQLTMDDFNAAKKGLAGYKVATFKSYPKLNHLFIAGEGKITPQEYLVPGSVDATFISDVVAWIKGH